MSVYFKDILLEDYVYFSKHPCIVKKITKLGTKITLTGKDILTCQERKTFGNLEMTVKKFIPIIQEEEVIIVLKDKIVTLDNKGCERYVEINPANDSIYSKIKENTKVEVTTLLCGEEEKTFIYRTRI